MRISLWLLLLTLIGCSSKDTKTETNNRLDSGVSDVAKNDINPDVKPDSSSDTARDFMSDGTQNSDFGDMTSKMWSDFRGIPDPSTALGFDVYRDRSADLELSADQDRLTITESGTANDPYVVNLNGFTVKEIKVDGDFVVIENGIVRTTGEGPVRSNGEYIVFRDIDVGGNNTDWSHGAAVTFSDHTVWLRGAVHNFGILGPTAPEQDQHGFKVQADDIWILNVETYELSGDGVQVGDASRGAGNRVYIGGGYFHDNRENAVDIKDSMDVVVSGTRMENFAPTNSSPGEAVIIHDDAFNAQILDLNIANATIGIVSSGKSGHLIDGNTIKANEIGIQLRNTRPITVTNNLINAPIEVQCQGGLGNNSVIEGCD